MTELPQPPFPPPGFLRAGRIPGLTLELEILGEPEDLRHALGKISAWLHGLQAPLTLPCHHRASSSGQGVGSEHPDALWEAIATLRQTTGNPRLAAETRFAHASEPDDGVLLLVFAGAEQAVTLAQACALWAVSGRPAPAPGTHLYFSGQLSSDESSDESEA